MELYLNRIDKRQSYTLGELYDENGNKLADTLEDADRNLDDSMPIEKINEIKKPGITAIPRGRYKVLMNVKSPRLSQKKFYQEVCDGKVPRLENVKGFSGVLIHVGNSDRDSSGCILTGNNSGNGTVLNSRETFKKLYKYLKEISDKGENIFITIK